MKSPTRLALVFLLSAAAFLAACGGGSGGAPSSPAVLAGLVDAGNPALAPADGYAGTATCRACHREVWDAWEETLHNRYTRKTDRPGATGAAVVADSNGNGFDDFRDGLNLAGDPDFAAFGASAPRLSFAAAAEFPYRVTIGATTYEVWRTLGGNGRFKQQYLARIGAGVFVLPVQYDEATADWVAWRPEDWYAGVTPRTPAADRSFDLQCAGCHAGGLNLAFDAATGQYLTGYTEATIGCESCHGPAAAHVNAGGDPDLVLNPADLLDGTVTGVKAADMVCARCHLRGQGEVPAGGSSAAAWPWRNGIGTFPPGRSDLDTFVTLSDSPADYWRRKDNPMGFAPTPADPSDDTFLASRSHHQQWQDVLNGPHAPDRSYDSTCFACHDPHRRSQPGQIRAELEHGGVRYTGVSSSNNKLCLACHHGFGDFSGVSGSDVQAITATTAPAPVAAAVVSHMKDRAAMPVDASAYAPGQTGLGRCTECHMPKTALSGGAAIDAAGNLAGDLHGHTFDVVWPFVSELTSPRVTNSCNACHPLSPGDPAAEIIREWVQDPDGDGTFHADTPRNFQTGVANPTRAGGVACAACHTTEGFVAIQVEDGNIHHLADPGSQATRDRIVHDAIRGDEGITCRACHGKGPDGTFAAGPNPLRFPKTELCGKCHNNETVRFEDYRDHGEIVRHPQDQMFSGVEGGEVAGFTYSNSPHTLFVGEKCVGCHMNTRATGNHTFQPNVIQCQTCHPNLLDFDRPADVDWDGDGALEGTQTEFEGALARLTAAILAATPTTGATITFDGTYWLIDGSSTNTAALNAALDEALLRAMFDHYWVRFDGSRGIHNTRYAMQLIRSSYEALTGQAW